MTTAPAPIDYHNGVYAFDAGYLRPLMAAIHLIVDQGRVAIVDTGSNDSLAPTLAALASLGLTPEEVDYIVLSHVHLDHAGGAGRFMAACANARLVVHPRGARHMADPSKLYAAVEAVYGADEAHRLYGELLPVPAERILAAEDGQVLPLGERELLVLHTPGHARHHLCLFDRASRGAFTGDVLGISYRELDVDGRPFLFPTSSPSQFEPDEMRRSIERVLACAPEALYLTHFSRVVPSAAVIGQLQRLLDGQVALARAVVAEGTTGAQERLQQGITRLFLEELRDHGCTLAEGELLELLRVDLELNAQGLVFWLSGGTSG